MDMEERTMYKARPPRHMSATRRAGDAELWLRLVCFACYLAVVDQFAGQRARF